MTRIIGGSAGGRRLRTPRGDRTRPTSDRVREALFSSVESWFGSWRGLRVLDLYAGSGALGLEAASRGAAQVTAVEHDRATARLVAANARTLGLGGVEVRGAAVGTVLAGQVPAPDRRFDLVLADPPYPLSEDDLGRDLAGLARWLRAGALVVLERSSRSPSPPWPPGIVPERSRRYGETMLWYGLAASPGATTLEATPTSTTIAPGTGPEPGVIR